MKILVKSGNVLEEKVDVLICTANPMLNMSGGVNGALLQLGASCIQEELREYLRSLGQHWVPEGSVVQTSPGPLSHVKHVLHAVSINGFYESSIKLVAKTLSLALDKSAQLGAITVATPTLATGYGPLSVTDFAKAVQIVLAKRYLPVEELRIVVRKKEDVNLLLSIF